MNLKKTLFLSVICLIVCSMPAILMAEENQWQYSDYQNCPGFNYLTYIDDKYIVGGTSGYNLNSGSLYLSIDGGQTWNKKVDLVANISKIKFLNNSTGFAVGGAEGFGVDSYIGKTTDGGNTWMPLEANLMDSVKSSTLIPVYGLAVVDTNTIYVSSSSQVYKSQDGGTTWAQAGDIYSINPDYYLHTNLQFPTATDGYVSSKNYLFHTSDGGAAWEKLNAPWNYEQDKELRGLQFQSALGGWAFVVDAYISSSSPSYGSFLYKTADGGKNWSLVYSWDGAVVDPFPSEALFVKSDSELWLGGWEEIWHSVDGGASWVLENTGSYYIRVWGLQMVGSEAVPRAIASSGMTGTDLYGYYKYIGGSASTTSTISLTSTTSIIFSTSTTTTIPGGNTVSLIDLSEWDVYGTAAFEQNKLIFGDTIGGDPQDQDGDGNPENAWFNGTPTAGPGGDYDWIVSKREFYPPLSLTWSGCFPLTQLGYQYAALAQKNPLFTAQPGSGQNVIDWNNMCAFHTRWESGNSLLAFTVAEGTEVLNTINGASAGEHGICGEFKISIENGIAYYYFNNTLVDQQAIQSGGPFRIFFRSYEKPFSIDSITVTYALANTTTTTSIVPAQCPLEESVDNQKCLDVLRMLRDRRFINKAGLMVTVLYYQNAAEITSIVRQNPALAQRIRSLVSNNISIAQSLINDNKTMVSRSTVNNVMSFLNELKAAGSPKLKRAIERVINGIENRSLLSGIGVYVQ